MSIQALNISGRPRLPVIIATEAAECGLACMAMIARYHGHNVDLNGMRQRFSVSLAGATLRSLMGFSDALGLAPRPLRVELSALRNVQRPAILHWDLDHFVVLAKASRRGIVIHDPATGKRKLPMKEASKHFTGVVLELAPTEHLTPMVARGSLALSSLWSRMKGAPGALTQVLILSVALQVATFAAPFQVQLVVDQALYRSDADLLTVIAIAFGALAFIQAGLDALRNWSLKIYGQLFTFQVMGNLVRHLLRLPAGFFEKRHLGDILSRMGSVQPIQDAITRGLVAAMIDGAMALVAAIILFFYSGILAAVVLGGVALQLVIAIAYYGATRARTEQEIVAKAKENSYLMESVRGAVTIKLLGREAEREAGWRDAYASVINAGFRTGKLQISQTFLQSAVTGVQTVLVTFLAARMIIAGEGFSIGMLFAFLMFRQTFTDRAVALINQGFQFRLLRLHLDRISDIIANAPEAAGPTPPVVVKGGIRAEGLSFRYGAGDPLIVENLDFSVSPGEFVAITGMSGGGKSTLVKLLLGLHLPSEGNITLDGHAANAERWRAWRRHIGYVAQDDRLMSGTLAENIAAFDPDLNMARVEAAAEVAEVGEDINRMPMRYLSLVGDMGSTLSGGQRQRVLLARAFYRQPKLLILDEGTANLDEATEEKLADLIASLTITRIVVAHRPALVRRADKVFLMHDRRLHLFVRPSDVTAREAAALGRRLTGTGMRR
jgi:ATP-binding cassette, subfamily B, bacterial CvaB/MchF/RaxB